MSLDINVFRVAAFSELHSCDEISTVQISWLPNQMISLILIFGFLCRSSIFQYLNDQEIKHSNLHCKCVSNDFLFEIFHHQTVFTSSTLPPRFCEAVCCLVICSRCYCFEDLAFSRKWVSYYYWVESAPGRCYLLEKGGREGRGGGGS